MALLLELNILCIIPILVGGGLRRSSLNAVKYFVSQRAVSLLFIRIIFFSGASFTTELICLRIIFKLGLPPFQRWLISILPNIKYYEIFLIFTIQKVIPLTILSYVGLAIVWLIVLRISRFIYIIYSLTSVSSIFILIFLSSSRNGLWMLSLIRINGQWIIFLLFYSLILFSVVISLNVLNVKKLNDSLSSGFSSLVIAIQFFNLGGVPPFIGFLVKLMILKLIVGLRSLIIIFLLIVSLIVLYIYVVMFYQLYSLRVPSTRVKRVTISKSFVFWMILFNMISGVWIWVI